MNNKLIGTLAMAGVLLSGCGGGGGDTSSTPADTTSYTETTTTTSYTTPVDTGLLEAYTVFDYDKSQTGHLFGECVFDDGYTEPMMFDTGGWWYVGHPEKDPDYITGVDAIVDGTIYDDNGVVTANVHTLYLQTISFTFADNGDSLSGYVAWRYHDTQEIVYCQATMVRDAETSADLDFYR